MPENQLTYDVKLNIAQARAEVNQLLRIFRSDLQTVTIPAIAPQVFTEAVAHTRALSAEFQKLSTESRQFAQNMQQAQAAAQRQAQSAARPTATASGGGALGGLTGVVAGSLAGYLTIQGVQQLAQAAQGFAELGVQVRRSEEAFAILSGGANIAEQRIKAIQQASGGTIDSMKAIQIGTQVAALGLAKTTEEFEQLTRAGRAIALVSPVIHDVGEALTQLSLFASNEQSFMRADQLGLSVKEVKDRMAELRAENEDLSGSEAKLQASLQLLDEKFGGVLDSGSAAASGVDKFKVAISEARAEIAKGPIGQGVDALFGAAGDVITGSSQQANRTAIDWVTLLGIPDLEDSVIRITSLLTGEGSSGIERGIRALTGTSANTNDLLKVLASVEQIDNAISQGVPNLGEYRSILADIAADASRAGSLTESQAKALDAITITVSQAARAFQELSAAQVDTSAIDDLVESFRQIDTLLATTGEFTPQQLPGIEQLQQALIALKAEIATTGAVTDEQRAAISQLEGVLSGASSAVQFMSSEEGRAALATGEFNAALASTPGYLDAFKLSALQAVDAIGAAIGIQTQLENSISSSLSGLISRGLITAQQAQGIAQQQQLQATQTAATIAGLPAGQRAFAQAQAQYDLTAPIRQIEENDRLAKQAIREQEAAQKRAAAEAGRAFKGAATDAGKAFKAAAAKLEGDLRSTPGLFGGSEVTQGQLDLAAEGIPQNFADDWVRQLRDEVQNGKDWKGVSIEQAKEALGRVGIVASDNAETVVQQIADAWNNSVLFSDPANLALINQEAVQANLDLQEKARQGQENILKHFGVVVDEAVEAATGGGGGATTPPVIEPPVLPPVAAPVIGPLPQFGQFGQPADTGGTLNAPYVVPVTVPETAMADITTQLFDQAAAEQEGIQSLGGVIGGMMEIGFLQYNLAPLASEFVSGIATGLAANGDLIKGQGTDYASIVALGIAGYDFSAAASSAVIGIRNGFAASDNLEKMVGTGSAIMQFIIDGMSGKANEEGALDGLAATLFAKLLESINEGV